MPDREKYPTFDEVSLHILDVAVNSIDADATFISIKVDEDKHSISFTVSDNGRGMPPDILRNAPLPRFSTKKSAGLGLFILRQAAEKSGGSFSILSTDKSAYPDHHGTVTSASFRCGPPLGDLSATVVSLIAIDPAIDFLVTYNSPERRVSLDTRKARALLGDVPLDSPEVLRWARDLFAP